MSASERLVSYAERGIPATVTRVDGVTVTGVLSPREGGVFAVLTGKRGRPAIVAPATVSKVVKA